MSSRCFFWIFLLTTVLLVTESAEAGSEPVSELLWPSGAPGAKGHAVADKPSVMIYLPAAEKAVGTAVVICPGGGYRQLVLGTAEKTAEWLNSLGVAAFILKYRHGGSGYGHPMPLQDAQRAVRLVRSRATQWNIDAKRIGVMGFSAGGHLAATVGTRFRPDKGYRKDPINQASCRPDFMILVYPLITLAEPYTHYGSRIRLLGDGPSRSLVESVSVEKQVKVTTPPAFIVHGSDDTVVPVENSVMFYVALQKAAVPAEMHIYQNGPHGFGLGTGRGATGPVTNWTERLVDWMKHRGLLARKDTQLKS